LELQKAIGKLALERVHDRSELLCDLLGRSLKLGKRVKEDTGGSLSADLGVGLGTLELIKTLDESTGSTARRNNPGRDGDTTDEEDLGRTSAHGLGGLLGANVDLGVAADGGETLKIKVLVEAAEFKKVVEGRSHVAAQRILHVATAMRVGVVNRVLLGNREDGVDSSDAEHGKLALVVDDGLLVSSWIAAADKSDVDNVHRRAGRGIRIELATEIVKDLGESGFEVASVGDNTEDAVPDNTLVLGNIGEAERPVALNTAIDIGGAEIDDAVGTVDTTDVGLGSSGTDLGILIREKRDKKVNSGRESGALGKGLDVGLGIKKLLAKVGNANLESRNLGLADDGVGSDGDLTILASCEVGKLIKSGKQIIRKSGLAEAVGEGLDLTEHAKDELVARVLKAVSAVDVNNGLEGSRVVLGELTNDIILELAIEDGLNAKVLVQGIDDNGRGRGEVGGIGEGSLSGGLGVALVSSKNVVGSVLAVSLDINGGDVKSTLEVEDLLHLGGVLELKRGKEVTSGNDGTGGHSMSDLTRLGGLDGHNHLHGLDLNVGRAHFNIGAVVLEVADDLTSDVGTELRRIKDGRPASRGRYAGSNARQLVRSGYHQNVTVPAKAATTAILT